MDPISLAIGAVGLGLSIFGSAKQSSDTKEASQHAAQIAGDISQNEIGANNLKQQQMEIEGRRMQLENVRNNQRARAMATNAAVQQGATLGSGLQGGLGQIDANSLFNMSGVNSALTVGRGINTFNNNISGDRVQQAQNNANFQSNSATNQGLSSLGGALLKSGPVIGAFGQGFGGGNSYGGLAGGNAFNNSNSNSQYYGPLN